MPYIIYKILISDIFLIIENIEINLQMQQAPNPKAQSPRETPPAKKEV